MSVADPLAGIGSLTYWGATPTHELSLDAESVALIGAGDPRHLLTLWARAGPDVTAHVFEPHAEVIARQLVLLALALEPELPSATARTSAFLEVFGNVLLRVKTATAFSAAARRLARALADSEPEGHARLGSLTVDCTGMKHRERDRLVDLLEAWAKAARAPPAAAESDAATATPPIVALRDERMRAAFGDRYDVRDNMADWDAVMTLQPIVPHLWPVEFRAWRESGQAFDFAQASEPLVPNPSLLATRLVGGGKAVPVFAGDILLGPWVPFGVDAPRHHDWLVGYESPGARRPRRSPAEVSQAAVGELMDLLHADAGRALRVVFTFSPAGEALGTTLARRAKEVSAQTVVLAAAQAALIEQALALTYDGPTARLVVETVRFYPGLAKENYESFVTRMREMGAAKGWHSADAGPVLAADAPRAQVERRAGEIGDEGVRAAVAPKQANCPSVLVFTRASTP